MRMNGLVERGAVEGFIFGILPLLLPLVCSLGPLLGLARSISPTSLGSSSFSQSPRIFAMEVRSSTLTTRGFAVWFSRRCVDNTHVNVLHEEPDKPCQ